MPKSSNRHFQALVYILAALYLFAIVSISVGIYFARRFSVTLPAFHVPLFILFIIILLILIAGIYKKREWARKLIMVLSLAWLVLACRTALNAMMTTGFAFARSARFPVGIFAVSLGSLFFLALGLLTLYLAMAYPVTDQAASLLPEEALPAK